MYIDPSLGHTIVALVRDEKGHIAAYKLEDGQMVSKELAVFMAKQGTIKGVSIGVAEDGDEFLQSIQDNLEMNNLENLPVVDPEEIVES
jgi:hypothetical protein